MQFFLKIIIIFVISQLYHLWWIKIFISGAHIVKEIVFITRYRVMSHAIYIKSGTRREG